MSGEKMLNQNLFDLFDLFDLFNVFFCIERHKNNLAQQQDRSGSKCEIVLIHLANLQESVFSDSQDSTTN